MGKFLYLLPYSLILLASPAVAGPTCLAGDTQKGPNCVHEWIAPASASSDYAEEIPWSTVYRPQGRGQKVVWGELPGRVIESSPRHIRIVLDLVTREGDRIHIDSVYTWDGQRYSSTKR